MIIFGSRASNIGHYDIPNSKCDHCHQNNTQRISVFGKYFHIFWIPIFPFGKKAVSECTHCKKTIDQDDFSPELKSQYNNTKNLVKRPFWHWFGLSAFASLVALIMIVGNSGEKDARRDLLQKDIDSMSFLPDEKTDPVSAKIKIGFDEIASEDINPEDFKYLTRIKDNKALILVKIPKLKKVSKNGRQEAIEIIESMTNGMKELEGKEKYIGVHGTYNMMMVKTPTNEENSKIASEEPLFDFYGPKVVVK